MTVRCVPCRRVSWINSGSTKTIDRNRLHYAVLFVYIGGGGYSIAANLIRRYFSWIRNIWQIMR